AGGGAGVEGDGHVERVGGEALGFFGEAPGGEGGPVGAVGAYGVGRLGVGQVAAQGVCLVGVEAFTDSVQGAGVDDHAVGDLFQAVLDGGGKGQLGAGVGLGVLGWAHGVHEGPWGRWGGWWGGVRGGGGVGGGRAKKGGRGGGRGWVGGMSRSRIRAGMVKAAVKPRAAILRRRAVAATAEPRGTTRARIRTQIRALAMAESISWGGG